VTGSAKNIIFFVEREVTLIGLGLGIRWVTLLLVRMFLLGLLFRCYLKYRTAVWILLRLRGWRCVKSGERRRTFGHLFAFLSDIFPHPSLEIGICTAYFLTSFVHNCKFLLCYFYSFLLLSRETSSLIILHRNPLPFLLIWRIKVAKSQKCRFFFGMQL